jgi:hypothetical protein
LIGGKRSETGSCAEMVGSWALAVSDVFVLYSFSSLSKKER